MLEPNERRIEKLLKSAGAKRREQAGAPEMHPAVREVLRTEIRRQYGPGPDAALSGFEWLMSMLPRLALLVGLGVCAWLLMNRGSETAPTRVAMGKKPAASASAEKQQRGAVPPALTTAEAASRLRSDRAGEELAPTQPQPVAPTAPQKESSVGMMAASPPSQLPEGSSKSVVGPEYFKADRQGMYMGTATVDTEAEEGMDLDRDVALGRVTESVAGAGSAAAPSVVAPSRTFVQTPVLQTFTVINAGNAVRVVDADGSTYEGTMQPVSARPSVSPESLTDASRVTLSKRTLANTASTSSGPNREGLLNYTFEMSGTNRSLGQTVRFNGTLALTEQQIDAGRNVFTNTILPADSMQPAQTVPAPERRFGEGRVQGTAVLEDGQDVRVDAVPSSP